MLRRKITERLAAWKSKTSKALLVTGARQVGKVRSHAALSRLLDVHEYRIREAVVLSRNNVSAEGPVLYAPIYMVFCLDELTENDVGDFTFAPVSLG